MPPPLIIVYFAEAAHTNKNTKKHKCYIQHTQKQAKSNKAKTNTAMTNR